MRGRARNDDHPDRDRAHEHRQAARTLHSSLLPRQGPPPNGGGSSAGEKRRPAPSQPAREQRGERRQRLRHRNEQRAERRAESWRTNASKAAPEVPRRAQQEPAPRRTRAHRTAAEARSRSETSARALQPTGKSPRRASARCIPEGRTRRPARARTPTAEGNERHARGPHRRRSRPARVRLLLRRHREPAAARSYSRDRSRRGRAAGRRPADRRSGRRACARPVIREHQRDGYEPRKASAHRPILPCRTLRWSADQFSEARFRRSADVEARRDGAIVRRTMRRISIPQARRALQVALGLVWVSAAVNRGVPVPRPARCRGRCRRTHSTSCSGRDSARRQ